MLLKKMKSFFFFLKFGISWGCLCCAFQSASLLESLFHVESLHRSAYRFCPAVNCWPSESGNSCDVNIEYELQEESLELNDVVISIPLP